jgi:hypothetical protein
MFLLGLIAFFQMTVIPGYLALKYFKVNLESKIQALIYGFVLSLLINYLLVFLFTAVGIYTWVTVYIVLLAEAALLLYYLIKSGRTVLHLHFRSYVVRVKDFFAANSFSYNLLLVLSLVMMGIFFYIFVSRIKAVFYLNDSVLGWNRFALDWFRNGFPVRSAHYPQLIPTNWSLAYMIIRNADIQMAARNIMPFFSIGILSLFLDLGLRKRKAVYLWASVLFGLIILYLYRPVFIAGGYVDIAVSFFSLLSFLVLYEAEEKTFCMKRCFWSVLFACTAAVTKQSGLFILVIIIAWNLWLMKSFSGVRDHGGTVFQKSPLVAEGKRGKAVLIMLVLVCVIVVSWYAYRQVLIVQEAERSEIAHVTHFVHGGRTYLERFAYGFNKILHVWGRNDTRPAFFIYPLMFFILLSLFHRKTRYMTLFIVIPFTVIWGFFYSYSYRNLTPAFPFMALAAAYGSYLLVKKLRLVPARGLKQPRMPGGTGKAFKLPIYYLALLIIPLLVLNFTVFKKDLLLENQLTQQRNAGDIKLNQKLYGYYEKHGFDGKIFSKYPNVQVLPVLRDYWNSDRYADDVHYYLYNFNRPRQQTAGIRKKLKSGEYKLLFEHREFLFIKIK